VGPLFLVAPDLPCLLVLESRSDGTGASIELNALPALRSSRWGLRLPSGVKSYRGSLFGLLGFNVGAVVLFAWVGIAAPQHGMLALPVTVLDAGIAVCRSDDEAHPQSDLASNVPNGLSKCKT
jgi:hypothetical protein